MKLLNLCVQKDDIVNYSDTIESYDTEYENTTIE